MTTFGERTRKLPCISTGRPAKLSGNGDIGESTSFDSASVKPDPHPATDTNSAALASDRASNFGMRYSSASITMGPPSDSANVTDFGWNALGRHGRAGRRRRHPRRDDRRGARSAPHAQLHEHALGVMPRRVGADPEPVRDLLRRHPTSNESSDVELARREAANRW